MIDLIMILVVIGLTFGVGVWYGANTYGRYKHTEEGSRAHRQAGLQVECFAVV